MSDMPPLVGTDPTRGIWLRVRQDPTLNVDVSFADRHSPPGPDYTWVAESMTGTTIDSGIAVAEEEDRIGYPKPDPDRLVTAVTWDEATNDWRTADDAGLGQLDTGDDLPNAAVPFDTGLVFVEEALGGRTLEEAALNSPVIPAGSDIVATIAPPGQVVAVDENDTPLCQCGHSALGHGRGITGYPCLTPACPCEDYQRAGDLPDLPPTGEVPF